MHAGDRGAEPLKGCAVMTEDDCSRRMSPHCGPTSSRAIEGLRGERGEGGHGGEGRGEGRAAEGTQDGPRRAGEEAGRREEARRLDPGRPPQGGGGEGGKRQAAGRKGMKRSRRKGGQEGRGEGRDKMMGGASVRRQAQRNPRISKERPKAPHRGATHPQGVSAARFQSEDRHRGRGDTGTRDNAQIG